VLVDVAAHQRLGEVALVLEVIEEAALGDADAGDQLVDRGGGEALSSTAASAISECDRGVVASA
jgi:hypothetical protein